MTLHQSAFAPPAAPGAEAGVIKLAVLAVGGQGGGVLTGWIETMARARGYAAQATSVAGVAQRTGSTIYYVEMAPAADRAPVFALAPAPGDVDVLIAAEMMEAGRAVMRGFVTPDRTTLIASSHRALAVSEKTVPGDGTADAAAVAAAAETAARRFLCADMERLAVEAGSVISASLFGALAGSGALPFPREAYEDAIRASGRGVGPSLAAFARGFEAAQAAAPASPAPTAVAAPPAAPRGPARLVARWLALEAEAAALPEPARAMALAGLRKVVDYQDLAYGRTYLDLLARVRDADRAAQGWLLTAEAAKHAANALCYDDVIRVADLKTRAARVVRVRAEVGLAEGETLRVTEYLHPRAEEIVGLLPAALGRAVMARPGAMRLIERLFGRGRRLRSDALRGFLPLYLVGGLRFWRRLTLRHAQETAHREAWLAAALAHAAQDYALGVEVLRNRRLIKGYSDTHARGLSKYDRVMAGVALLAGRPDAAEWTGRLREAALRDEKGEALDGALQTVRSFV